MTSDGQSVDPPRRPRAVATIDLHPGELETSPKTVTPSTAVDDAVVEGPHLSRSRTPPARTERQIERTTAGHGTSVAVASIPPTLLRSTGANGEVKFKSREEGNPDKHPLLCVTYSTGAAANESPIVDAGPNQTIVLSGVAILDATVTDDGAPNPPGAVETTWTQVTGPGIVTFGDPSAVDTTASFSAVGNYVLRLTADDGELMASDDLTITVADWRGADPVFHLQWPRDVPGWPECRQRGHHFL